MVSALFTSQNFINVFANSKSRAPNLVRARLAKCSFRISNVLEVKQRRSANYHPTVWETGRIESFETPYSYKLFTGRLEDLKATVRLSFETAKGDWALLNVVDSVERLGVAYHFEDEIREAVSLLSRVQTSSDLYFTALRFRVLRQHGFSVSTEVFDRFRGENGGFESLTCYEGTEGILSLYEASFLAMPGEDVLDEAKTFCNKHLKYSSSNLFINSHLAKKVKQSLQAPLHWRMPRIEARNFIDLYQTEEAKIPGLLELAKLDYNLVQSVYQDELKELARWWRGLGFKENLDFARDRLMENFLWVMGIISEPPFSKFRIGLTKFVCFISVIDDIYDIYGSLEELESFTNAVEKWESKAASDLPLYMKICYLALLKFGNELIDDVQNNHGFDVSSSIKKAWLNQCRSYLVEARWFFGGHTPTLDEYLENACTSVGGPAAMAHTCVLLLGHSVPLSSLESCLSNGSKLIHCSSLVTRLNDDLGTSKDESERGDVAKSVECYTEETGMSEEEALNHVRELISHSWKRMNKEVVISKELGLPKAMVKACLNMARTSHCIYQHGDGIGTSTGLTRDRLESLIVKPVPFEPDSFLRGL